MVPTQPKESTVDFDTAFHTLLGHEGGFTEDPRDPGNWTGGRVGAGELRGMGQTIVSREVVGPGSARPHAYRMMSAWGGEDGAA